MKKRRTLFLVFLTLTLSASFFAQKSPLVITGTVLEVKVDGLRDVKPNLEKKPYDGAPYFKRTETWYSINLKLQYHNRGDEPLIILAPNYFIGTKKLLFLDIPSPDSMVSAVADEWEWNYPGEKDLMPKFVDSLEGRVPGIHFKTIAPGQYFETFQTFRAKSGFKIDARPNRDPRQPNVEFAIPEYKYFKIQYSLSMKDPLPVAEAKARWSKFGKLVTSADGDFFFETEVIINKLPD